MHALLASTLAQDIQFPALPPDTPWMAVVFVSVLITLGVLGPVLYVGVNGYQRFRNNKMQSDIDEARSKAEQAEASARSLETLANALTTTVEDRRENTAALRDQVEATRDLIESTRMLRTTLMDQDERIGLFVNETRQAIGDAVERIDQSNAAMSGEMRRSVDDAVKHMHEAVGGISAQITELSEVNTDLPRKVQEQLNDLLSPIASIGQGVQLIQNSIQQLEAAILKSIQTTEEKLYDDMQALWAASPHGSAGCAAGRDTGRPGTGQHDPAGDNQSD